MFQMDAKAGAQGFAHLRWSERGERRDGMTRSEGCYLLRRNVTDWSGEELWRACIQKRCVSRPTDHRAMPLQRPGLEIPTRLEFAHAS